MLRPGLARKDGLVRRCSGFDFQQLFIGVIFQIIVDQMTRRPEYANAKLEEQYSREQQLMFVAGVFP